MDNFNNSTNSFSYETSDFLESFGPEHQMGFSLNAAVKKTDLEAVYEKFSTGAVEIIPIAKGDKQKKSDKKISRRGIEIIPISRSRQIHSKSKKCSVNIIKESDKTRGPTKRFCSTCSVMVLVNERLFNSCGCKSYCKTCYETNQKFSDCNQKLFCVHCDNQFLKDFEENVKINSSKLINILMHYHNNININSVSALDFVFDTSNVDERNVKSMVYANQENIVKENCHNYTVFNVVPDGHCLLYAIAIAYFCVNNSPNQERMVNSNYFKKILLKEFIVNNAQCIFFVEDEDKPTYYNLVGQYIINKNFDNSVCDMVPELLAKLLRINLRIHSIANKPIKSIVQKECGATSDPFIEIAKYKEHYYALYRKPSAGEFVREEEENWDSEPEDDEDSSDYEDFQFGSSHEAYSLDEDRHSAASYEN